MIQLLILNGVMFWCWWWMLAACWRDGTTGDRLLGAWVFTVLQLCGVWFVLGMFGGINPATVLILHLFVSIGVWVCGLQPYYERPQGLWWHDMVLARVSIGKILSRPVCVILCVLVTAEVIILTWYGLSMPVMSYDGWGYHMSKAMIMVETGWIQPWLWNEQAGTYTPGFTGYDNLSAGIADFTDFYPANVPVLTGYALMFTKSTRWASLVQMPFWGLCCLSVYRIVRGQIRASIETAAVCGLGVFTVWTMAGQAWYSLGDLAMTGLLWAGFALVWVNPVLGMVAAGLAAGCKLGALYSCVSIMALGVYRCLKR